MRRRSRQGRRPHADLTGMTTTELVLEHIPVETEDADLPEFWD
ncbi:hypothetical protein [Cellulomonas bogoriensis]|nr:hypothetical protein [Cellulomonas bogoriensis]